jgi:hypothetical protein
MPAFTFEKISPRAIRPLAAHQPMKPQGSVSQQRDKVIQVLGRFVEARVRDDARTEQVPPRRPLPK